MGDVPSLADGPADTRVPGGGSSGLPLRSRLQPTAPAADELLRLLPAEGHGTIDGLVVVDAQRAQCPPGEAWAIPRRVGASISTARRDRAEPVAMEVRGPVWPHQPTAPVDLLASVPPGEVATADRRLMRRRIRIPCASSQPREGGWWKRGDSADAPPRRGRSAIRTRARKPSSTPVTAPAASRRVRRCGPRARSAWSRSVAVAHAARRPRSPAR